VTTARACALLPLLVAALGIPRARAAAAESSYVLIVAANRSLDPGVRPLRFADDDGARYFELFSRTRAERLSLLAVLDADTARTHPDAARAARVPWLRELRDEVRAIARAVEQDQRHGRRTRFTFIYIGHGNVARDGEGYVSLQDVRLRRRDLFREIVDAVPAATIHLVIDACKSFYLVARGPEEWKDDRGARSYGGEVRAFLAQASLEANPHVGAILSTSGDEEVHEWSALRSGVFSHELRSALAGAADLNGDGRVEYSEVGAFIAAANQRVAHPRARIRPHLHPPTADRHAALFEPGRARGPLLELPAASQGRFSIEDGRGVRVVDLHKAAGDLLRISLGAERHFVRHGRREALLPAGRTGVVRFASLPLEPVRADARGALDAAYREELFALPFSRGFYEGYLATADLPSVSFRDRAADRQPDPGPAHRIGLGLELGYQLAAPPLELLGGLEHGVAVAASYALRPPLHLALRVELGGSRHPGASEDYTLLRAALLAGVELRLPLARVLSLGLEATAGWQGIFQLGEANSAPAGVKLGSALSLRLTPFARRELALVLRAGLHGHLVRVGGELRTSARPEGGIAVGWGF
jgi:hypothetical protein